MKFNDNSTLINAFQTHFKRLFGDNRTDTIPKMNVNYDGNMKMYPTHQLRCKIKLQISELTCYETMENLKGNRPLHYRAINP